MLLTNTASWTYSKRQVCQGVDVVLAFITEPIWVKAFRVRIVLGVTVQPNDGNKEDFSWMYFHRRVRFQYVGSNTHSINSCSWWIESQSFCKYNKTSCFAQKCNLRRLQRVYCVRWCTGVTKMCLYCVRWCTGVTKMCLYCVRWCTGVTKMCLYCVRWCTGVTKMCLYYVRWCTGVTNMCLYCVRWCTGVTKMCLYFESAIPYLGTHVIVV